MKNTTPLFPGFHLPTLRRTPRTEREKWLMERDRVRRHSLSQLSECFGSFIPQNLLDPNPTGALSRRRLFSKENTFWALFSQMLDADGGCQEVVRKVQAAAAKQSRLMPSASTSAYCQARSKIDIHSLQSILDHTAHTLALKGKNTAWKDRRVIVVDGTGLSMPDTEENQSVWPQPSSQKPGCGFPSARLSGCFCLQTGALLSHALGNKKNHELPLLRQQHDTFRRGDIFLGDKGYCSYYDVSQFQTLGIDSVITLARRTPVKAAQAVKVLGDNDRLIAWSKPTWSKQTSYSKEAWKELPDKLILRQIKVTIDRPGYRPKSFHIITTLTDDQTYSADEIADLYLQRWDVELFFRDLKTTMGMDILRCRTPAMVEKEIILHFIVYNAIRLLMTQAAHDTGNATRRIGFKASVQALRQWEPLFNNAAKNAQEQQRLLGVLYEVIAENILLERDRPNEPRCVKRRAKPFRLMTRPRDEMRGPEYRGK